MTNMFHYYFRIWKAVVLFAVSYFFTKLGGLDLGGAEAYFSFCATCAFWFAVVYGVISVLHTIYDIFKEIYYGEPQTIPAPTPVETETKTEEKSKKENSYYVAKTQMIKLNNFYDEVQDKEIKGAVKQLKNRIEKLQKMSEEFPDMQSEYEKFMNIYVSRFLDSAEQFEKYADDSEEWKSSKEKLISAAKSLSDTAESIADQKEEEIQADIIATSNAVVQASEQKTPKNMMK